MSEALDEAKRNISMASSLLGIAHAQRHPIANLKVLEALTAGVVRLAYALEELEECCCRDGEIKIGGSE